MPSTSPTGALRARSHARGARARARLAVGGRWRGRRPRIRARSRTSYLDKQAGDARRHARRRRRPRRHQQVPERRQRRHPRQPEPALPGSGGLRRARDRQRRDRRERRLRRRQPRPRAGGLAVRDGHGRADGGGRGRGRRARSSATPTDLQVISQSERPVAGDGRLRRRDLREADPAAAGLAADRQRAPQRPGARHRRLVGRRASGTRSSTPRRRGCSTPTTGPRRTTSPSSRPGWRGRGRRVPTELPRPGAGGDHHAESGQRRLELPRVRVPDGEPERRRRGRS